MLALCDFEMLSITLDKVTNYFKVMYHMSRVYSLALGLYYALL